MKKIYYLIFFVCVNLSAQNVPFTDAAFKSKVLLDPDINLNGDLEIQILEASQATFMDVSQSNINSLNGLEYFTNLKILDCSQNNISNIDLIYGLSTLEILDCSANQYTAFNLVGLNSLTYLSCGNINCTSMSFNGQQNITNLFFTTNQGTLDVSSLTGLQELEGNDGALTNIYFGNILLKKLRLFGIDLSSLDVSTLLALDDLLIQSNIGSVTLGNLPQLLKVVIFGGQLTSLNVSGLTNLEFLLCNDNQIATLDVTGLSHLQTVSCPNNNMTSLIINSTNIALQQIICNDNNLTALNTSGLTSLIGLNINNNYLTSLNLQGSPLLGAIVCNNNNLTELLIKNNSIETNLTIGGNPNLVYICADPAQLVEVQNRIAFYGYTNCVVDSACNLSTNNPNANQDFAIYPNPSNGKFTINYNNLDLNNSINLSLTDMQGRMVYEKENALTEVNTEINLENVLQAGVYFLKLKSNNFEKTIKVVVE